MYLKCIRIGDSLETPGQNGKSSPISGSYDFRVYFPQNPVGEIQCGFDPRPPRHQKDAMKKFLTILVLLSTIISGQALAADKDGAGLEKYHSPAEITKLDWLLLKIQLYHFTEANVIWDDLGLISDVNLFAAKEGRLVGMTFYVNRNAYERLDRSRTKETFLNVLEFVTNAVRFEIPEVVQERDVYANFVLGQDSTLVAEYEKGALKFIK